MRITDDSELQITEELLDVQFALLAELKSQIKSEEKYCRNIMDSILEYKSRRREIKNG